MKISVVITCYNLYDYIRKCLDSIINQTYKNLEVIIVNDCSTDNSLEILNEYKDKYDFINIINLEKNVGAGLARRIGIKYSTGDYLILIDGDDWIEENYLESLLNNAIITKSDIVSSGISFEFGNGKWDKKSYGNYIDTGFEKTKKAFHEQKVVFLNNKLVNRKLYDIVEYSERRLIEDTQTIFKLFHHANQISYIENTGYHYVQRESSLSHDKSDFKKWLFTCLCVKDILEFIKENNLIQYTDTFNNSLFIKEYYKLKYITYNKEDIIKHINEFTELFNFLNKIIIK